MTIETKAIIDPLTRSRGFIAFTHNDSAFGFTRDEAKVRLMRRLDKSTAIYDEDLHAIYHAQTEN
jgi:hypothetical protein